MNSVDQQEAPELANRVRSAVFWRSGSQFAAQILMWAVTIIVVRLLAPEDYGLFAMSQVLMVALNFLTGQSFASSLIQEESVTKERIGQVFGLLILFNASLATVQMIAAPFAADYFRQPILEPMLYWQLPLYAIMPVSALASALLARRLAFRNQAKADMAGAICGAGFALWGAWHGYGVWTLVFAPIIQQGVRAIGLCWAAKLSIRPRFNFKGIESIISFGSALVVCQFLWVIQSQADVFIAGRILQGPTMAHEIGLYTEALFLTLIFTSKFIPPLNEVAFPAYTALAKQGGHVGDAFIRTARLLMFCAVPAYFGMSAVAHPMVELLLGPKWLEMVPLVAGLPLAMPFFALQIICSPTTNALGKPRIYMQTSLAGAIIMAGAFLIGSQWGVHGLVQAWHFGMPLLLIVTLAITLPVIGASWRELGRAIAPSLIAGVLMYICVLLAAPFVAPWSALAELVTLGLLGAGVYIGLMATFGRAGFNELLAFVTKKQLGAATPQTA